MGEDLMSLGFKKFDEFDDYFYYKHQNKIILTCYNGIVFSKIPGKIKAFKYDLNEVKTLVQNLQSSLQ